MTPHTGATPTAFEDEVYSTDLLNIGIEKLGSWWRAVENRDFYDQKAAKLMKSQLSSLGYWIKKFKKRELLNDSDYKLLEDEKDKLSKTFSDYTLKNELSED